MTSQADLPRASLRWPLTSAPSLSRATPSAVSEHSSELIGCPIPRSLTTSCVRLERGNWHRPSSRPNHESQLSDGDEAHETARLDRRGDQALDGACAPEQECAGHCEAAWTLHSFRQTTRASIGLASAAKQRWTTVLNPRSTVQKGPSDKATAVMRKRPSRDRWPVLDLDPIRRLAGAVGSMAPLA